MFRHDKSKLLIFVRFFEKSHPFDKDKNISMFKSLIYFAFLTAVIISCGEDKPQVSKPGEWQTIFNGRDLEGWKRLNGDAEYVVEEGVIIGETKRGAPNTFLVTEKVYGDIALEFEVMIDTFINSGVQFRSNSTNYMNGKVHGYQVEIDPSSRAWSGGIYDESRRGWLYPMELHPKGGKAFKPKEWNKIYVEAKGSEIRTWVNDVPAAYLIDDMTPTGFVALQIHSIPDRPEFQNRKIKWRNIKIMENPPEPREGEFGYVVNTKANHLSQSEVERGWELLFDGQSMQRWRTVYSESFPDKGWEIKDSELILRPSNNINQRGGDIITREMYGAFEFQVEYKLTQTANTGVKYFVTETYDPTPGSGLGLEFQIIDVPGYEKENDPLGETQKPGALYDLIAAEIPDRFVKGPGSWNHLRIVSKPDNTVQHWLNYIKVLEYKRGSRRFKDLIGNSKFKDYDNFGTAAEGHILLQDHGSEVKFRSMKVRPL